MKIYYFSAYYNEERLIPYIFRHYDKFVDKYFIWDHQSTDRTRELLEANPKVTVFDLPGNEFDDYDHRDFKNNCWKGYDCDYVINVDADEFVYRSGCIKCSLGYQKNLAYETKGYQMFASELMETTNKQIYDLINKGIRESNYDKTVIFDPKTAPVFSFGAHKVEFNKPVTICSGIFKLLHYNILGPDFIDKMLKRNERLSERNKQEQLSYWPDEKGHRFNPYEYYEYVKQNAKDVI